MRGPNPVAARSPMPYLALANSARRVQDYRPSADLKWDFVTALLPLEGEHGSTNYLDLAGNDWLGLSQAQIVTNRVHAPAGALQTDGSTDGIYTPNSAKFNFPGDFAVECRALADQFGERSLLSNWNNPGEGWTLQTDNDGHLLFNCSGDGIDLMSSIPMTLGVEHHIEVDRINGTIYIFLDGFLVGTVANATSIVGGSNSMQIGLLAGFHQTSWIGTIRWARITNGVGRNNTNFQPPLPPLWHPGL